MTIAASALSGARVSPKEPVATERRRLGGYRISLAPSDLSRPHALEQPPSPQGGACQLIEMMGGRIGVVSALGAGSTFWFTIHLEEAPGDEGVCDLTLQAQRVLIVDDNHTNRTLLRHLTRSWGMVPIEANDGPAALKMIATEGLTFDVALVDFQMPGMTGLELASKLHKSSTAKLPIVLLTSVGWHRGEAGDFEIAAFLTKPVRRARLQRELQSLVGRSAELRRDEPIVEPPPEAQVGVFTGRVLVVEDNTVNQRLARRFVEKLGCAVDLASNGKEALASLKRRTYDLVLMDCQMPIMDGFEATRQIRSEAPKGHRTPIVAMTASAMGGDRERCLSVGMDDYITKPLKFSDLRNVIARWCGKVKQDSLVEQ